VAVVTGLAILINDPKDVVGEPSVNVSMSFGPPLNTMALKALEAIGVGEEVWLDYGKVFWDESSDPAVQAHTFTHIKTIHLHQLSRVSSFRTKISREECSRLV
jgi:hypothetical protein